MSTKSYTKVVDLGWEGIQKTFKNYNKEQLEVGIFPDAGVNEKGIHVAGYAYINEFGEGNVPSRPWMRDTLKTKKYQWKRKIKDSFKNKFDKNASFKEVMEPVGKLAVENFKDAIYEWSDPPNAESTIRRKKKDDPLVDTEKMVKSIKYKINKSKGS